MRGIFGLISVKSITRVSEYLSICKAFHFIHLRVLFRLNRIGNSQIRHSHPCIFTLNHRFNPCRSFHHLAAA